MDITRSPIGQIDFPYSIFSTLYKEFF
ncbi:uncharacterized protein METZ01_LOCUS498318, partial [marine metagenome]